MSFSQELGPPCADALDIREKQILSPGDHHGTYLKAL